MLTISALALLLGQQGWFPFVIPWNDASHTVTDMSYMNVCPAGKNGRIVPRDGHFVEQTTGKRVRFLAVNMVAAAAFPSHADADATAAHLAKLGVNLVRFHHLQNPWDVEAGGSIWKKGRVYIELDPVQLDKMDYLFAALKKHGIYSNMNLQTTRSYLPEMGFPKSVLDLPFEMDKRIDKVDRRMIELQKEYAVSLLGRKNRYTGLFYKEDPSLAFVEINNENSLVGWPGESAADTFNNLPEPFRGEVITAWNKWLVKRYGSDASLTKAWSAGYEKLGDSIFKPGVAWTTENQSNGDVKFESPNPGETRSPRAFEVPSLRATVNSNSGPDWHVQIHVPGLTYEAGRAYTLRFRAKCSTPSSMLASAVLDEPDWHNVGLSQSVKVGPAWREYSVPFTATEPRPEHNRIGFTIGALRGVLEIEGLTVLRGMDRGPIVGGTLTAGTVPLPQAGIKTRTEDFYRFLTATETAYGDEMRAFLKGKMGIRSNLVDTQVAWGGITSVVRERASEYADNHAYWQHPNFPGKAWDTNNWTIANTPMVDAMLTHTDELSNLAKFRFAGKPYTISEYNHPAPSDYRVEMMPLLASVAALQDWDGFYLFEYGVFGTGRKNDQMGGFFDVGADPVRAGFMPSAAMIFRTGDVSPLPGHIQVPVPADRAASMSVSPWAGRTVDILNRKLSISGDAVSSMNLAKQDQRASVVNTSHGAVFKLVDPRAYACVGAVSNQTVHLQAGGSAADITLKFGEFGRGFAAATWTKTSKGTYLLTLASRAENQGIEWNANRTSIGANWGHGPVLAEGVPCEIEIKGVQIHHVWALEPTGKILNEVPCEVRSGACFVRLGADQRTIWYEFSK